MDLITFARGICVFLAVILIASDIFGLVDPLKKKLQQLKNERNKLLVTLGVSTISWALIGILVDKLERKKDKDSREVLDHLSSEISVKDEIVLFLSVFIIGIVVGFYDIFLKISSKIRLKRGLAVFGIVFGIIAVII